MRDRDIAHTSIVETIYMQSPAIAPLGYSERMGMATLCDVNYYTIVVKRVEFVGLVDARGTADGLVVLRWREDNAERR